MMESRAVHATRYFRLLGSRIRIIWSTPIHLLRNNSHLPKRSDAPW
jgi:hypothetical protein